MFKFVPKLNQVWLSQACQHCEKPLKTSQMRKQKLNGCSDSFEQAYEVLNMFFFTTALFMLVFYC